MIPFDNYFLGQFSPQKKKNIIRKLFSIFFALKKQTKIIFLVVLNCFLIIVFKNNYIIIKNKYYLNMFPIL